MTDRPDFTESTSVVPRGRFQLESGYTFVFDHERGRRSHENVFPEFLLRSGIVKNWELRVGWEGFSLTEDVFTERNGAGRPRAFHEHADGGTDMIVGFKAGVLKQQGLVPDFSVIGALSLPTGTSTKSAGNVDPELKLLWGYELSERFSLAGNVNFAAPTEGNRRFFQTAASLSLGMSLTDWLGAYAEYYGFYPNERNTDAAHYFNGGFTFPIAENFQLDLRAGMGLNEEADDFLAGAGVAFRF